MKRLIAAFVASLAAAACSAPAETPSIDAFFDAFTAEWVRMSPNQAISARYFSGPEQDALETQITPTTRECRQRRVNLARRGPRAAGHVRPCSAHRDPARVGRSHENAARGVSS